MAHDGGIGHDAYVGEVAEWHLITARRGDRQRREIVDGVPDLRDTPHDHVEHLLVLEEVADDQPGHEGGRLPADVARLHTEGLRRIEVDFDLDGRLLQWQLNGGLVDPLDADHGRA